MKTNELPARLVFFTFDADQGGAWLQITAISGLDATDQDSFKKKIIRLNADDQVELYETLQSKFNAKPRSEL